MESNNATEWGAVIIALLGFFTAVVTAISKFQTERKAKNERLLREQAEKEIEFQRGAIDFAAFIEEWGEINSEILALIEETEIDRFLILRAWNGYLKPRWTTAVYQVRETSQKPVAYIHFELDTDYVTRLREICTSGYPLICNVADMPESAIKYVYEAEGVTAAIWKHLHSDVMNDGIEKEKRSVAVTYCSFATHDGELQPETITRCNILAMRLKGIAEAYTRTCPTLV